jgi:Putative DNA-binding domain
MEELVRQLIAQAAESRGLDYKRAMAWVGTKAERAELIWDLMCFSNTPDGGYILVGVEEGAHGWVPAGVTPEQGGDVRTDEDR